MKHLVLPQVHFTHLHDIADRRIKTFVQKSDSYEISMFVK